MRGRVGGRAPLQVECACVEAGGCLITAAGCRGELPSPLPRLLSDVDVAAEGSRSTPPALPVPAVMSSDLEETQPQGPCAIASEAFSIEPLGAHTSTEVDTLLVRRRRTLTLWLDTPERAGAKPSAKATASKRESS
jgi:hypothetical protein